MRGAGNSDAGAGDSAGGDSRGGGSQGTPPAANEEWSTFKAQSGDFAVYSFNGYEEVCKPYEFGIELVSLSANEDIVSLLGTPALLTITDRAGGKRLVHRLNSDMQQLHTANRYTHYSCSLTPRLWFLGQITDHRIFQEKNVQEIIGKFSTSRDFPETITPSNWIKLPSRANTASSTGRLIYIIISACVKRNPSTFTSAQGRLPLPMLLQPGRRSQNRREPGHPFLSRFRPFSGRCGYFPPCSESRREQQCIHEGMEL